MYESYDVTDFLKPGKNAIGIWLGNGYGTSYSIYGFRWLLPLTARLQLNLDYADGRSARIVTDRTWKASGSPIVSNCIYDGEKYDARLEQDGWSKPDFDDSRLLHSIRNEKQDHLDTGIFATKPFLEVLADNGSVDVAINVLLQETYPSFGYQIKNGATTTWEWWPVKSPLNSHDHAMFGGIGASFYTRLAGIRPLSPGYYEIAVEPVLPKQLDQATCTMQVPFQRTSCMRASTHSFSGSGFGIPCRMY